MGGTLSASLALKRDILEYGIMKTLIMVSLLTIGFAGGASAAGCLKGAAIGATAGHFMGHHAVLGGVTGCVIGRHNADNAARERREHPDNVSDLPDTGRPD
jgi:hypothetical protein